VAAEDMKRPTFPQWALGIAKAASSRSEDPYVQVGSVVLMDDWQVIGVGYNGLPSGVDMPDDWWLNRDARRPFMIHAEVNALRSTVTGVPSIVVSTHIPCAACMSVIGSYGISLVYWSEPLGQAHDLDLIRQIAKLNGIALIQIGDTYGNAG
jgi:dCMP deaminase